MQVLSALPSRLGSRDGAYLENRPRVGGKRPHITRSYSRFAAGVATNIALPKWQKQVYNRFMLLAASSSCSRSDGQGTYLQLGIGRKRTAGREPDIPNQSIPKDEVEIG
jgi:hypothetical protein